MQKAHHRSIVVVVVVVYVVLWVTKSDSVKVCEAVDEVAFRLKKFLPNGCCCLCHSVGRSVGPTLVCLLARFLSGTRTLVSSLYLSL